MRANERNRDLSAPIPTEFESESPERPGVPPFLGWSAGALILSFLSLGGLYLWSFLSPDPVGDSSVLPGLCLFGSWFLGLVAFKVGLDGFLENWHPLCLLVALAGLALAFGILMPVSGI